MAYENHEDEQAESVYNDDSREDLVENDEISPEEEAFMSGYDEDESEEDKDNDYDEAYEKAFEE